MTSVKWYSETDFAVSQIEKLLDQIWTDLANAKLNVFLCGVSRVIKAISELYTVFSSLYNFLVTVKNFMQFFCIVLRKIFANLFNRVSINHNRL